MFKKIRELEELMKRVDANMSASGMLIAQQREVIDQLARQNRDLMNRLMAVNFQEYSTFGRNEFEVPVAKEEDTTLDFSDDDLAGTVVNMESENG